MKKIYIYILSVLLFFALGCGTIKKITGWGDGDEKTGDSTSTTTKVVPPPEKVKITSKTAINWVLYSAITVAILVALRYGVKRITNKKE